MITTGRCSRLTLPLVAAALLLTGCGIPGSVSTADRPDMTAAMPRSGDRHVKAAHGRAKHAKARRTRATTSARRVAPWAQLVDKQSGIRFALPHAVAPRTTRLRGSGTGRVYQAQTSDGIQLAVGLTPASAGGDLDAVREKLDELVLGLRNVDAKGVHVEDVRTLSVHGYPALDAGVVFVGRNDDQRSVWRIRCVMAGATTVMMQTITFADPGDRAMQDRVAALQERLTRSLRG